MKRCPECRRDYFDDTLSFCLEDGTRLIVGLTADEPATAIIGAAQHHDEIQSVKTGGAGTQNSIAVLPFVNISADPENEYFCDGLSEEILNALSHIDNLKVAARTSAFSFKHKNVDIGEIARKLGVKTILDGSVRKVGNRVRISVELANADDGYRLWSDRFDRELDDIFDIQDEITLAVVDSLKLTLLGERRTELLKRYTGNTEAYSLYLRGRFFWNKRTTDSTLRAIDFYEQAIAIEPKYAPAYSGLADCYNTSGFAYDLGAMPASDVMEKAKRAATTALDLDDTLAEAHTSLAYAKHLFDWDWAEAEAGFLRALRLNPNYANARHWYAHLLMAVGRIDEAFAEGKRALELDPVSAVMTNHMGWHQMYARDYDAAIAELNRALLLDPEFVVAHWYLGIAFALKGEYADAEAAYEKAMKPEKHDIVIRADAAHFYAVSGQTERAKNELNALNELSRDRYVSSFGRALICVGLGEHDRAFEYFDKSFEEHSDMLVYLNVDPRLDSIRGDSRFKSLVKNVGLPS